LGGLGGGFLLVFTAIWDCCDGDVARLKFMESDFGEYLDTLCDNIINVFIFVGIAVGVSKEYGILTSAIPFALLALGGISIFILIYFPRGTDKGGFFKGTRMYDVILLLASRNFVYIIFLFSIFNSLDWFLWIAGFGANIFALTLLSYKRKILPKLENNSVKG
jgi:phosphatidylglycerophosphate synthase